MSLEQSHTDFVVETSRSLPSRVLAVIGVTRDMIRKNYTNLRERAGDLGNQILSVLGAPDQQDR